MRRSDDVDVIGHEAPGVDADAVVMGMLGEEIEVELTVGNRGRRWVVGNFRGGRCGGVVRAARSVGGLASTE